MKIFDSKLYNKLLNGRVFTFAEQVWIDSDGADDEYPGYYNVDNLIIIESMSADNNYKTFKSHFEKDKLYWARCDDRDANDTRITFYMVLKDRKMYYHDVADLFDDSILETLDVKIHDLHERGMHYKTIIEMMFL